ncbi:hypothetical protein LCGC14_0613110 [marine sediment metagenome]|uniref:Uncharacterized protein n=1 Tax=marine sediment metagenome TaxID=412755 RepID=A0A0F9RBW8_9ZZZZ
MALAQTPTAVAVDPRNYWMAIHGGPGVGKTSFCKQIPGHYFFHTPNAGIEGVSIFGNPIFDWASFLEKAREVIAAKENNFKDQREIKICIVDVLGDLFDYAGVEVCAKQRFMEKGVARKYDKIDDVPFGKGYKAAYKLLLRALGTLYLHGFGILLTSHTKERVVKWAGEDLTHYGFNLPPSASLAVKAACGAIGHFRVEETIEKGDDGIIKSVETGRFMYWQPTFLRLAKHRLENFPEKLPLPLNRGWETYCDAFAETVAKLSE